MEKFICSNFRKESKPQRIVKSSLNLPPLFAIDRIRNKDNTWDYVLLSENNKQCFDEVFTDNTIKKTKSQWNEIDDDEDTVEISFQDFIYSLPANYIQGLEFTLFEISTIPNISETLEDISKATVEQIETISVDLKKFNFDPLLPNEYVRLCLETLKDHNKKNALVLIIGEFKEKMSRYYANTTNRQKLIENMEIKKKHNEEWILKNAIKTKEIENLARICRKYFRERMDSN